MEIIRHVMLRVHDVRTHHNGTGIHAKIDAWPNCGFYSVILKLTPRSNRARYNVASSFSVTPSQLIDAWQARMAADDAS
jgi:hypothetical protein